MYLYILPCLFNHTHTHACTHTHTHTHTHWPEQRNLLLLICAMRLLARRRGLAQRAPLVSMGFERRKSASHFTLQSHTKGFWARWLMGNHRGQDISQIKTEWSGTEPKIVCVCECFLSQGLDAVQRAEGAFRQTLDFVVIQRQQRQVLQIFEHWRSDAVDLVGIQQPDEHKTTSASWTQRLPINPAFDLARTEQRHDGFSPTNWEMTIMLTPEIPLCKCQFRQINARCGSDLQQLQRGQAVKHSAGQLRDLITIQHPAHREQLVSLKGICVHIFSITYCNILLH